MKKKIAITTICALVILISMTSSLFAGSATTSFNYKFRNENPRIGVSYGVSYLSNINGTSGTLRDCGVYVKAYMSYNAWSLLASYLKEDTTEFYNLIPLSTSRQSDSSEQVKTFHMAGLYDEVSMPRTVTATVYSGTITGTAYPQDP